MVNELTRESFVISCSKASLLARGMLSVLLSDANSDGITASFVFLFIGLIFFVCQLFSSRLEILASSVGHFFCECKAVM